MNFPKSARVLNRAEFLHFFNGSELKRLPTCMLFRISSGRKSARVGITVKARSNSVYRNKFKRQIRESFRLNHNRIAPFDYNVLIPAHIKANHHSVKKVRTELDRLWSNEGTF